MLPILKSWLSINLEKAIKSLENYEYKSEGLALSNIYFHHLALIQYYHKNYDLSKETFEKNLEVFDSEKLRTLYYYHNLFSESNKNNKYISLFIDKYPDQFFYLLEKNKKTSKKIDYSKVELQKHYIIWHKLYIHKICMKLISISSNFYTLIQIII